MIPHRMQLCRYRYDPLNRLARRDQSGDTGATFFYRHDRLATQVQGTSQRSILQTEDCLLAQRQSAGSGAEVFLLAADRQRSVLRALHEGQPFAQVYSAYGYPAEQSSFTGLPGFAGEQWDPVTGHYLLGNGYRAFNPVLMRFNGPDSLSPFEKGGLNAYAYCQGDPINRVDPDGHIVTWLPVTLFGRLTALAGWMVTAGAAAIAQIVKPRSRAAVILSAVSVALGALGGAMKLRTYLRGTGPSLRSLGQGRPSGASSGLDDAYVSVPGARSSESLPSAPAASNFQGTGYSDGLSSPRPSYSYQSDNVRLSISSQGGDGLRSYSPPPTYEEALQLPSLHGAMRRVRGSTSEAGVVETFI